MVMATSTGAFLAGVGTTFVFLAVGFGGGLMLSKTVMEPRAEQQALASAQPSPPVRVILPASAEPAQPPQPSVTTTKEHALPPVLPSVKEAAAPEQAVEKVDTHKAEAEERARRKRYAERKAKRQAADKAKRQQMDQGERKEPPIMAFDGDEPRQRGGFGFFGN
jgi:hypothetical protein